MITVHSFDIRDAQQYGDREAYFLYALKYWITKNESAERNFHDGRYWTYNTVSAWQKLFPYLTDKQIRNVLESLEKQNAIVTGYYNESAYDRTKWYALTDDYMRFWQNLPNCPNGQMVLPERANQFDQTGKSLQYTTSNITSNEDIENKNSLYLAPPQKEPEKKERKARAGLSESTIKRLIPIRNAYPKHGTPQRDYIAINAAIKDRMAYTGYTREIVEAYMLNKAREYAAFINTVTPKDDEWKFIPACYSWFSKGQYTGDATTWNNPGKYRKGNGSAPTYRQSTDSTYDVNGKHVW